MYQIRVLVNGHPIPVYRDYRTGTDWIEARNGTKYEIEVRNDSYNRILAVTSVDGLNVINGKHEDSFTAPGYILHQHNNIKIPGWKISADNVREFFFTPQENSYSAKLGANSSNTGVIATAIYKEKSQWTYYTTTTYPNYPWTVNPVINPIKYQNDNTFYGGHSSYSTGGVLRGMSCSVAPQSMPQEPVQVFNMSSEVSSAPVEPKLATGSGAVTDFRTHSTSFGERLLETIITLYYDTREGLERRGIFSQINNGLPRPFPNGDFCPDV